MENGSKFACSPTGGGFSDIFTPHTSEREEDAVGGSSRTETRIRRPMNAFMLFSREQRLQLKEKVCDTAFAWDNVAISIQLGNQWQKMTPKERAPYLLEAKRLQKEYDIKVPKDHPSRKAAPRKPKGKRRRVIREESLPEPPYQGPLSPYVPQEGSLSHCASPEGLISQHQVLYESTAVPIAHETLLPHGIVQKESLARCITPEGLLDPDSVQDRSSKQCTVPGGLVPQPAFAEGSLPPIPCSKELRLQIPPSPENFIPHHTSPDGLFSQRASPGGLICRNLSPGVFVPQRPTSFQSFPQYGTSAGFLSQDFTVSQSGFQSPTQFLRTKSLVPQYASSETRIPLFESSGRPISQYTNSGSSIPQFMPQGGPISHSMTLGTPNPSCAISGGLISRCGISPYVNRETEGKEVITSPRRPNRSRRRKVVIDYDCVPSESGIPVKRLRVREQIPCNEGTLKSVSAPFGQEQKFVHHQGQDPQQDDKKSDSIESQLPSTEASQDIAVVRRVPAISDSCSILRRLLQVYPEPETTNIEPEVPRGPQFCDQCALQDDSHFLHPNSFISYEEANCCLNVFRQDGHEKEGSVCENVNLDVTTCSNDNGSSEDILSAAFTSLYEGYPLYPLCSDPPFDDSFSSTFA